MKGGNILRNGIIYTVIAFGLMIVAYFTVDDYFRELTGWGEWSPLVYILPIAALYLGFLIWLSKK